MFDKMDQRIKSSKLWRTKILPWLERKIAESKARIAELEAKKGKDGNS